MSESIIQVENLSKLYHLGELHKQKNSFRDKVMGFFKRGGEPKKAETIWALNDVSFEVKEGEIVGIIGRNGAGKSTLLKILSRITKPTRGKALINGRVSSLLEVGTGFHPELTGRENIFLNGSILGMKKIEIAKKFDEIVAFAEIEKFLDTPVKRYSSGMYVRLAFAVAAHLEPEILLVDEVLAVGDAAFQKKCLGKMENVAGKGRTVLFVSHDMGAISSLCRKVFLLENGSIVHTGSPSEVIDAYLLQSRSSNESQKAEIFFPDKPEKDAQIRRIRITDPSDQPTLVHDILSPIRIDMEFDVKRHFPNLFIACTIRTTLGQTVFTTNEMDWTNYTAPSSRGTFPKEPGYYKSSIVLPAPLLHAGNYELICTMAIPKVGNVDPRGEIFIEITDNTVSFATFPFKRKGFFVLPLQWDIDRL